MGPLIYPTLLLSPEAITITDSRQNNYRTNCDLYHLVYLDFETVNSPDISKATRRPW